MVSQDLEQRLRESEARANGILDAVVDGVVIIDSHGIVSGFNPAAERIFGCPRAAVIGKNVSSLMPEPDRTRHDTYLRHYLDGGEPQIIGIGREVTGRRTNGELFPMELAVGEVSIGDDRQFVGVVRDISERRAIADALARSEAGQRLIFANAPIGILTTGFDRIVQSCNPALSEILNRPVAEIVGTDFADLGDPKDRQSLRTLFSELSQGQTDLAKMELVWIDDQGNQRFLTGHFSVVELERSDGFVIVQIVDRTAEIATQKAINDAREQLAHVGRLTTMGEMASAIAHEINQPLTAIATHAQACRRIVLDGDVDEEMLEEAFAHIGNQALRAGEVVKGIRGFVSKRESERQVTSLYEILRTVLNLADADLRTAGMTLDASGIAERASVLVDPLQIQQVCLNLIRNAIDASLGEQATEKYLAISINYDEVTVTVNFDDRAGGVDENVVGQLFHPFFTTKDSGMGMGLSISHSIIAAHEGELIYAVNEHGGSRFSFSLPRSDT